MLKYAASSFAQEILNAVRGTTITLIEIGFIVAVVAAIVLVARWLRALKPADETVVLIRDLTTEAAASEATARALTEQLLAELRSTHRGFGSAEDVDESEDLDGSVSLNLRAMPAPEQLGGVLREDIPIKVGVVETSLRPLLGLWSGLTSRAPAMSISGSFANTDPEALLVIESARTKSARTKSARTKSARTKSASARIEIRRRGEERRGDAIRDAAAWIITQIRTDAQAETGSDDWRSLREYRAALACLERESARPDDRAELLQRARLALQASLAHDPGNLMARFYLATVLRKLGENEAALGQLQELEQDLHSNLARVEGFLAAHHTFLDVVRYNLAVVLTKLGDRQSVGRAVKTLETLLQRADPALGSLRRETEASVETPPRTEAKAETATLPRSPAEADGETPPGGEPGAEVKPELDSDRLELRIAMLAVSARASAQASQLRPPDNHDGDPKRLAAFRKRLRDDVFDAVDRLEKLDPQSADTERRAAVYARAVVYTARGRARIESGDWRGAIIDLRRAISLAPDLVQAYLQLGELYLDRSDSVPDWVEQSEAALTTALAMSPGNRRAHNLLGRLYARDAVGRYDEAIAHLSASSSLRSSLTEHARLLERQGDLRGAVAMLRRAVARFPRPGYHYQSLVEAIERLAAAGQASRDDLFAARCAALEYWGESGRPQDREKLIAHLRVLTPACRAATADPGGEAIGRPLAASIAAAGGPTERSTTTAVELSDGANHAAT
jgi:tetratricopeptide (TPR) repeat protein